MRPDAPSATARMVARGIAYVARVPRWQHVISPEAVALTEKLLVACSPAESRLLALLDRSFFRRIVAFVESSIAPGILLHFALRKRVLERLVTEAVADGFKQIVILGAGLDTLALRQHRVQEDVPFFEIDHPATQKYKRAALDRGDLGWHGSNFALLAADLGERKLSDVLNDCPAYDPRVDTLFLAEGLLMYLAETNVRNLFSDLQKTVIPTARCRFLFTFMEPQANGKTNFAHSGHVLDGWLRLRGEFTTVQFLVGLLLGIAKGDRYPPFSG